GGHDEERLAEAVALERLADAADGAGLVVALDDGAVDLGLAEGAPAVAPLDEEVELVLGIEAADGARGVSRVVPQPVLVAVGAEDDGPPAELLLEAIGVELGLLLSDARLAPGALGLDDGER